MNIGVQLGAWQTEGQFSDGTLRLLGLLWAVLDRSGPLLLEEPELNLHSEVVRYLPQMFAVMQRKAGRQVIVSTHSDNLLRDEGIELDEVLLLKPKAEGTAVTLANQITDVEELVRGGVPLPDVLLDHLRKMRIGSRTQRPVRPRSLHADGQGSGRRRGGGYSQTAERMAAMLRTPSGRISAEPDSLEDPKRHVVDLARHSTRSEIKESIVPRDGSGRNVGPAYNSKMIDFVRVRTHKDSLGCVCDSRSPKGGHR